MLTLINKVLFLLRYQSLKVAAKEQNLLANIEKIEKIISDYSKQYNHGVIDGKFWNYKVRAHHAFQLQMCLNAINLFKKNFLKKKVRIIDIGDSSGTHVNYLKNIVDDLEIETLSVNLDPLAVKKIQQNGHQAILARAEDIENYDIDKDIFISFQTLEHLNSPIDFLKSISDSSSCKYFVITVPYLAKSRVALEYIRNQTDEKEVHSENVHIFELNPKDWKLIFKHAGWEILEEKIFYQYPKFSPLRLLKSAWREFDFEGFYGVILKRNDKWKNKFKDW
ncbi:hypothetical protein OAD48_00310 [Candidatus Pelagibacter sp.]|nr:hypothetical protein [Candidatus Pelagibacter sp.]